MPFRWMQNKIVAFQEMFFFNFNFFYFFFFFFFLNFIKPPSENRVEVFQGFDRYPRAGVDFHNRRENPETGTRRTSGRAQSVDE